jgi:hypothetical protein
LQPVLSFYNSISPNYLVEIHLTNNNVISNYILIETFNDYYVFCKTNTDRNLVEDKIIIQKDKIQYIKFLPTNNIAATINDKSMNL